MYYNIEKSTFRRGEYVGYANGDVYRITKSTSSFGNWYATTRAYIGVPTTLYAFTLKSMSAKLAAVNPDSSRSIN